MKKSDRKYAEEYLIDPSASKYSQDRAVYIGKWYHFQRDEKTVKKTKYVLFSISLLCMGFFALGGLIDAKASFTPYVFLPYVIMFLPIALNIGCTAAALSFKEKITHKQYDKKISAQKTYSYASALIAALTLVGDMAMYILRSDIEIKKDAVFTLCVLMICVLSFLSVKIQKNLICK